MWFFMYACYLLTVLTAINLFLTGFQGYFRFSIFHANHPTFALLTIILYLFTQTLIIFFFVGTGVSVRDYTKEHNLDPSFHRKSIAIKMRIYPPLLLNMLFVIVVFVTGAAVDTKHFPSWAHGLMYVATFIHYLRVVAIEHGAFKDDVGIILEMSGIARSSAG